MNSRKLIFVIAALAIPALILADYSILTNWVMKTNQSGSWIKTLRKTVVTIETEHGPVWFNVSIVDNWFSRARGLQQITSLAFNEGMLFIYDKAAVRQFWMKNTPLPLDIIFVGETGHIVHIARNARAFDPAAIGSVKPAKFVLEANAGEAHSLSEGDRVSWSNR